MNLKLTTLFIASLLIAANVTSSLAQQADPDRVAELEGRIEQAKQRLNLTDEQIAQIGPILKSSFEATLQVLENHGVEFNREAAQGPRERLSFREMKAIRMDLQAVREETVAEMADVLTGQQMEEYLEIQEERRADLRERIRARAS